MSTSTRRVRSGFVRDCYQDVNQLRRWRIVRNGTTYPGGPAGAPTLEFTTPEGTAIKFRY